MYYNKKNKKAKISICKGINVSNLKNNKDFFKILESLLDDSVKDKIKENIISNFPLITLSGTSIPIIHTGKAVLRSGASFITGVSNIK